MYLNNDKKINIRYACYLNSSGYSFSAQNYILSLNNPKLYDIKIDILGDGKPARPSISDKSYEFYMGLTKKKSTDGQVLIYHCIPPMQRKVKNRPKKTVGFATFETFDPPRKWVEILNKNDAVIVPSLFNKKVFLNAGINKPIYYIPHCLNFNDYHRDVKKLKKYEKFTFLFIGTWRERKGYHQLIDAWLSEFYGNNEVQLVIKTDKSKEARRYIDKVKKQLGISKGFSNILIENKVFDVESMPSYMKSFDCLLMPTMGEGFNIPGLQSMALGVPVIITDFSGCTDYASEKTATLLKPEGFVIKKNMDNIPQFRDKKWAFVSAEKIKDAMIEVMSNREVVEDKVNNAYTFVKDRFNYESIEKTFREMLGFLIDG